MDTLHLFLNQSTVTPGPSTAANQYLNSNIYAAFATRQKAKNAGDDFFTRTLCVCFVWWTRCILYNVRVSVCAGEFHFIRDD